MKVRPEQDTTSIRSQPFIYTDSPALNGKLGLRQDAAQMLTAQQPAPSSGLLQGSVRLLLMPARVTVQFAQAMANTVPMGAALFQNTMAMADKVVAQVLSFFFGHKKERAEEDKEQRRKNDFLQHDPSGERKVEQSGDAGFAGGQ